MSKQDFLVIFAGSVVIAIVVSFLYKLLNRMDKKADGDSAKNTSISAQGQQKPSNQTSTIKNKLRSLKDFPRRKISSWKMKRSIDQGELKNIASRLLQTLNERAVEKVRIREVDLSTSEVDLLIAVLDIAYDKYRALLADTSEKLPNSIQHSLQDFRDSIQNEVRSEFSDKYGLGNQEPEKIKELIAFNTWCEEKSYQLQQARELIDLGEGALKCFEAISGRTEIKAAQLDFNSFPERWREIKEERDTLRRDLQEEKKRSEELGAEPKKLEAQIERLKADLKSKDGEIARLSKELSKQSKGIEHLEADKEALKRENLKLKEGASEAQATLGKIQNILPIAEQLQHGSRALFHYLPGGLQSQSGLSCLIYFSLSQLTSGIVQGDSLKQQLMLFNLHSIANRCKEYGGTKFVGFSLAYDSINKNIESDYGIGDVEQKKQELSSKCSFQHADLDFFSQILRDLRSMASVSLSPFYLDANENRPQAAN